MNKKHLILIAVLAVLVVVYIISEQTFRSDQQTFDPDILKIDSASIHQVMLVPAGGDTIVFEKQAENWKMRSGSLITIASKSSTENMIQELISLRIDRLASNSEDDLEKYQLTDSLSSYIIVKDEAGRQLVNLQVGKVSFLPRSGSGMYGGQRNVDGITYFRIGGDRNIYAASSFIGMMVTMTADNWRDHVVFECKPESVMKVSATTPGGTWVLSKEGNVWTLNSKPADSTAVKQYLSQLAFQPITQFGMPGMTAGEPVYTLQIEQANASAITVTGSAVNDSTLLFRSSANPEYFIAGKNEPFVKTCFPDASLFLTNKK
jgi:hypothetical protein